ncbi:MAG: hypothetical protein WA418_29100 [Bradyrhizobium sp.]
MLVSSMTRVSASCDMVANKPGAPGRLRISVKTVAQGMPVDRHHLWYLPPAFFFAGGPWVRPSPGIPCALCILARAMTNASLGHQMLREREAMLTAV